MGYIKYLVCLIIFPFFTFGESAQAAQLKIVIKSGYLNAGQPETYSVESNAQGCVTHLRARYDDSFGHILNHDRTTLQNRSECLDDTTALILIRDNDPSLKEVPKGAHYGPQIGWYPIGARESTISFSLGKCQVCTLIAGPFNGNIGDSNSTKTVNIEKCMRRGLVNTATFNRYTAIRGKLEQKLFEH